MPPWAPTSMPALRDEWLAGSFDDAIVEYQEKIPHLHKPREIAFVEDRIRRLRYDREQLTRCALYWVSRDMAKYAAGAAASLPKWTPRAAMPATSGLLCWAKSVAVSKIKSINGRIVDMPVDAMTWNFNEDGSLAIGCCMRLDRGPRAMRQLDTRSPFLGASDEPIDADLPQQRSDNSDVLQPVTLLGAAWLLMSQTTVSAKRRIQIDHSHTGIRHEVAPHEHQPDAAEYVSLVELRHLVNGPDTEGPSAHSNRTYTHRWWVDGHWRQQACGPGWQQHKPRWIAPHIRGPEDKPLAAERVNVWRR